MSAFFCGPLEGPAFSDACLAFPLLTESPYAFCALVKLICWCFDLEAALGGLAFFSWCSWWRTPWPESIFGRAEELW